MSDMSARSLYPAPSAAWKLTAEWGKARISAEHLLGLRMSKASCESSARTLSTLPGMSQLLCARIQWHTHSISPFHCS